MHIGIRRAIAYQAFLDIAVDRRRLIRLRPGQFVHFTFIKSRCGPFRIADQGVEQFIAGGDIAPAAGQQAGHNNQTSQQRQAVSTDA
jgi:hypothetical protein